MKMLPALITGALLMTGFSHMSNAAEKHYDLEGKKISVHDVGKGINNCTNGNP